MTSEMRLIDFIDQVKSELLRKSSTDPFFTIDGVTLEVSFAMRKAGTAGVKLYVLSAGTEIDSQQVHKVTLKLTPIGDPDIRVVSTVPKSLLALTPSHGARKRVARKAVRKTARKTMMKRSKKR